MRKDKNYWGWGKRWCGIKGVPGSCYDEREKYGWDYEVQDRSRDGEWNYEDHDKEWVDCEEDCDKEEWEDCEDCDKEECDEEWKDCEEGDC